MSSRARATALLTCCAVAALGCESRGVSIGTEELCTPDARLAQASERDPSLAPSPCSRIGQNVLINGGFEAPFVPDCIGRTFCQYPAAQVPGWGTSSEAQHIEIWLDSHVGVPAFEGAQFVELDATTRDTLFQDLELTPGQLMYWSLAHRGRTGVEGMELRIGPVERPLLQGLLSSGEEAWQEYSGLYRVAEDATTTRIALVSRSGVEEGNLVDVVVLAPVDER